MIALVTGLASFLALCVLLPSLLFFLEVCAGYFGRRGGAAFGLVSGAQGGDVVILMPAHNEASGIEASVRDLLPQLNSSTRLLVVADNCTDNTHALVQALAQSHPFITVLERHNAALRGKGFALHHGIEHLRASPPAFVVILDADCKISECGIANLTAQCQDLGRPVQALYLMHNPPQNTSVASKLAEFAWLVKNQVRALGGRVLGVPCPLMGTGMAFQWAHISEAPLATGHLVEDMQLGVDLALAGTPPVFCNAVRVTSEFPVSGEGQQSQRTRWEHGHLSVILSQVPRLFLRSLQRTKVPLLLGALDIAIPPLALLSMLVGVSFCVGLVWWLWTGHGLPMYMGGVAMLSLVLGVGMAWSGFGRSIITLRELGFIPLYVMRKIPLYALFLFKRQTAWVRSKREGEK